MQSAARLKSTADSPELCVGELDRHDDAQWNAVLTSFDDANVAQTLAYGSARWGKDNLRLITLNRSGRVVAAALVFVKSLRLLGTGLAYVKGGPLWRLCGENADPELFRQMLRTLRELFVQQRGLLLQVVPGQLAECTPEARQILQEEGFEPNPDGGDPETALIDLSLPLDDIRRSLRPTWRRNLVLSERHELTFRRGTSDELFQATVKLYGEGLRRRKIAALIGESTLVRIQSALPLGQRIKVMLCEHDGIPVSGLAVPFFGDTAQAWISGTGSHALGLRSSYSLHWQMLGWLKEEGCRWYDLDGIDPRPQSGDAQFKLGFAGREGIRTPRLGRFEAFRDNRSRLMFKTLARLRQAYREIGSTARAQFGVS